MNNGKRYVAVNIRSMNNGNRSMVKLEEENFCGEEEEEESCCSIT